jgi:hypothetical protein
MMSSRGKPLPWSHLTSRAVLAVLFAVALGGCSVERLPVTERPAPSPSRSTAAPTSPSTVAPSESPDPALWTPPPAGESPGEPPADLPLAATVERDGVRLTIELERNPMPAGEWTRVRTEVTNLGPGPLTWFHDGCATLVWVSGEMPGSRWRSGFATFDGQLGDFERRAHERTTGDGLIRIVFLEEARIGRGSYGCADIGLSDVIAAGETLERVRIWDGFAFSLLAPPPGGPVRLTGTFGYYWRGEEPRNIVDRTMSVELAAWIEPIDIPFIHPSEAIDVALLDRRLVNAVASVDLFSGNEPIIRFDPSRGDWLVGLVNYHPEPFLRAVIVDGRTGSREAWVERAWDLDVDGFP